MSRRIGNVEFEVDGVKRGFRLGNYAISVAQSEYGARTIEELFRKMGLGMAEGEGDTKAALCLFYGSAVHYHEHKYKTTEKDFVLADVSDWLEYLGEEKTSQIFSELLQVYQTKNFSPPVNPGVSKQA